jgi:hypothetical protein
MRRIDRPIFCMTSDTDWASDFAIAEHIGLLREYGVRPTLFVTHTSPVLSEFVSAGGDVGLHPNFLPGSTHGSTYHEVIDHIQALYPQARVSRSHAAVDGTLICHLLYERGIRYDSNIALYFQSDVVPLRHESGLVRFPVFWEEDLHWHNTGGDWNLDRYLPLFFTPGLKVLNVHPFMIGTNCPDHDYYLSIKQHITTLNPESVSQVRFQGPGPRTFLCGLLEEIGRRGHSFYTLAELYQQFPIRDFLPEGHPDLDGTSPRVSQLVEDPRVRGARADSQSSGSQTVGSNKS